MMPGETSSMEINSDQAMNGRVYNVIELISLFLMVLFTDSSIYVIISDITCTDPALNNYALFIY